MGHGDLALVVGGDAARERDGLLEGALLADGFEITRVASHEDALRFLADNTPVIIVVAQSTWPEDGCATLRAIRRDPRAASAPIVVLAPTDEDELVARAFDAGAGDVIRPPLRKSEIVARIRGQLRVRGYVDALAQRERDANVVLELTQALSSTLDFRDILFTVVRRIAEFARVERCSLVLARDQSAVGYVVAASDDKELRDLPIDLGKYPEIREVMLTGEVLIIDDPATHPLFDVIRAEIPENAFCWLALIPVPLEGKPMGVLILRSLHPVTLLDHEISLARTVANATAIALRNARILQSLRDQTQQITFARFEAERRLKALQRYADFFYSTADGIIVIDADALILFSNPRAQAITGRSEAELSGSALTDLVDPKDRARVDEIRAGFARGAFPHMIDIAIHKPSEGEHERRVLSVSFSAVLREESGATLVSFRDVTADRATATELTKAKEELRARETQALIAELAGAAAHELNQPLTTILGYAELIRRRVDDPASVQSATSILISEAERMAEIVRKIGRITRYETKSYVGSSQILDLERASSEDPQRELR